MTSDELKLVLAEMPRERVTLSWIRERIRGKSAELVLVMLGLVAMLPGVSVPVAFILIAPAVGLLLKGGDVPMPESISELQLPSRPMRRLIRSAVSALAWWDRHGRWMRAGSFPGMRRLAGLMILLLAPMLLIPIPLSNVLPGFAIAALAFACLEGDAVLFCAAAGGAIVIIALSVFAALSLGGALLNAL